MAALLDDRFIATVAQEDSMKSPERLSQRVTVTAGIIFVVMMMALVLWSSWVFRKGLVVLDASSPTSTRPAAAATTEQN
jgi:hypothetical protein